MAAKDTPEVSPRLTAPFVTWGATGSCIAGRMRVLDSVTGVTYLLLPVDAREWLAYDPRYSLTT